MIFCHDQAIVKYDSESEIDFSDGEMVDQGHIFLICTE